MSFEFEATIDQPIPLAALARFKNHIVRKTAFDIVRDAGAEFGLAGRAKPAHSWGEDIAIVIESGRVYVAFYRATRDERNAFVTFATKALDDEGIITTFKEL